MMQKFYQNDFPELERVVPEGCLFMSLIDIVAEEFNHQLTREKIHDIYHLCNERGIIGTWENKYDLGAYVWDHATLLNMASVVLGYKDAQWEYCARIYTELEKANGRTDYVLNSNYNTQSQYLIFQVKTTAINGHFKRMSYDPLKFGSKEICLRSTRYYRRVNL
jgi:hypothetical protein